MTSYISSFKPILIALAIVVLIESVLPRNTDISSNPFFELRYLHDENSTDACITAKLRLYDHQHINFVQVGDSSSLTGVRPEEVMKYLPPGVNYINGSCHAILSYYGYRYMAEVYLRQNTVNYLVLSVNPMAIEAFRPIDTFEGNAPKVYAPYLSFWRHFYQIPSISWRSYVLNYVYYGEWQIKEKSHVQPAELLQAGKEFQKTYGWVSFSKDLLNKQDVSTIIPCPFESLYSNGDMKRGKPLLKAHLDAFKALADRYNARLIVLFNPTRCHATEETRAVQDQVEDFQRAHPDVYMPFPLINPLLGEKDMGDYVHPLESGANIYSAEIGRKLTLLLKDH